MLHGSAPPKEEPQKGERRLKQRALRAARLGGVDEIANDLGVGQLQADAGKQQHRQQGEPPPLRAEVGG